LREFGEMGLWQSELDERAADIEKKAKEIDDVLNEIKILHGVIENTENGFRKKLKEKNEKIKSLNRKFGDLEKGFLAKNSDIEAMMREFSNTEDSLRFQLTQLEIQNLELQTRHHQSQQYTSYNSPPYPGQSPFTQNHLNTQHSPIEEDDDLTPNLDIELVQNSVIFEDNNTFPSSHENYTMTEDDSPNIRLSPDQFDNDQILIIDSNIDAFDGKGFEVIGEEMGGRGGRGWGVGVGGVGVGDGEEDRRLFEVSQTDTEGF
jgi:hypothetical protein